MFLLSWSKEGLMIIRLLINDRRKISRSTISTLIKEILDEPTDDSFPSYSVRRRVEEIKAATSYAEQKRLTNEFLDFMKFAWMRQSYDSAEVDYTKWRIGRKTLSNSVIGICPVCKRKGEIHEPNDEYNFKGETLHKTKGHSG